MKGLAEGEIASVPLDALLLDDENPRLPEKVGKLTQDELLVYIEKKYDPLVVGRSIVLHQYFVSEPLIVIAKGKKFVVVEGNRRLTALRLLSDEKARTLVGKRGAVWKSLAQDAVLPDEIPVIIAPNRPSVAPIVGYRHISGIQEWDPLPKARYITKMVDDEELDFEDVAELVGESEPDIRSLYRNYAVLVQAADHYGVDTTEAEEHFSILTAALSRASIRSYIGAPTPGEVSADEWPVVDEYADQLRNLMSWLFGDKEHRKAIAESRALRSLAEVLGSDDATAILVKTRDLDTALEAVDGSRDRLMRRLRTARNALRRAREDFQDFADDEAVSGLIEECRELIEELETDE